jgi:hypothetical protein
MTTSPVLRTRIFNAVAVLLNLTSIIGLLGIAVGVQMAVTGRLAGDDVLVLPFFGVVSLAIVFTANYLIFGSAGIWNKIPARDKLREDAA